MNKLELSTISIIKLIALIIGIWLLILLHKIFALLFIVMIIVTALEPIVSWGIRYRIPRALSTTVIYLLIIGLVSLIIYLIIPPIVVEIKNLAHTLPTYSSQYNIIYDIVVNNSTNWQSHIETITKQLSQLSGGFYNTTISIFGGVASFLTVLVLSFYSLVDKEGLNKFLLSFIPEKNQTTVVSLVSKISAKLGQWLRGQIAISLIMGVTIFLLLIIAGVPYALTIGVIAAILEIIPIIGAVVTGVLAVCVALIYTSWVKALIVLGIYIIIQQLESHYLIPKIMSKAVGLYPTIIIVALLIGSALGGMFGAILAIPITTTLIVAYRELINNHN